LIFGTEGMAYIFKKTGELAFQGDVIVSEMEAQTAIERE